MVDLQEGSTIFRENQYFVNIQNVVKIQKGNWSESAHSEVPPQKCGAPLVYLEFRRGAHQKKIQTALELRQKILTPKREPA